MRLLNENKKMNQKRAEEEKREESDSHAPPHTHYIRKLPTGDYYSFNIGCMQV